ncbi:alpha/beta hydrolase-fold protein [Xanthomonas sp. WHRI 8391]|uniref:Ferri-bacillibactin esterase BesA n=1 Tax=Xanthomonas hortorum pv. carotae TaxID=487904 RepID=A0A6V7C6F3_9XANT|nr:alpha/beta hydrolase-fold protein [Xanthomonas hortorum]ETC86082.1 esterase [Xanthomonas hortorum pv. carotae str. M081]MBG3850699.1 alpha/beta hydrolase [Xanthomonas hortorum pv. carotae]UTS73705.1 alpha/beta hydrolase-fold protein [Xanthomonas hortorum]CAD0310254.1 Ferri-bacillibactin esterase BesA [Xanthomonas hortorum pv. carotae]CAD0310256.1 Ferri-bacillibactin esterase BesA [Xanthomonas hortorum pv. carotae]
MSKLLLTGLFALLFIGCTDAPPTPPAKRVEQRPKPAPAAAAKAAIPARQRGEGKPYEMVDTQVWDVPDPASGRNYQVFVALPRGYADNPGRRYPVLYATDGDYAFPVVRQIARRLNGEGPAIEDFILVGLSYAVGDEPMPGRRRDYTPTPEDGEGAPPVATHGKSAAYIAYLRDHVLPFVAKRYRTDEHKRLYYGHSYGGLLGTQILLQSPEMFSGYLLGSPSYWYGKHAMTALEAASAAKRKDLPAQVYLYVGEYEQRRYHQNYDMVTDAQAMVRRLRARGYASLQIELEVLNDEDHLSVAPRGITHGLKHLLRDSVSPT